MTSPVEESFTDTSKKPLLKTIAESVVFWSIFPMLFDCVAMFFGGSTFGPGYMLGLALAVYSSSLRDEQGKQYRPNSPFTLLWLLVPAILLHGLSVTRKFEMGSLSVASLQLAQLCIAVIAFIASVRRVDRLPINPVKSVSEEWLSRKLTD